jgi:Spy/CpxP family protein refolding chaperone
MRFHPHKENPMNTCTRKLHFAMLGLALSIPLTLHAEPPGPLPMGGPGGSPGFFPPHGGPFNGGEQLPPFLIDLNLSESQRSQILEVFKTQGAGLREKFEARRKVDDELRRLALSADYNEDKAKTLADNSAKIAAEAALIHAKIDQAAFKLLTPQQQQQLKERMDKQEPNCPKKQ